VARLQHHVASGDNRSMPSLQAALPDFLDSAPLRVVSEVTVMAPIADCWSLLADQASWVQWFDGMTAVQATPWVWTEPGQTRVVTINGLNVHETAISLEPEREYAFTITKWPLPTASMVAEGVIGKPAEGLLQKQLASTWEKSLRRMGDFAAKRAAQRAASHG